MPGYLLIIDLFAIGFLAAWLAKDPIAAILTPMVQFVGIGILVGCFTPASQISAKFALDANWSVPVILSVLAMNIAGLFVAFLFGRGHDGERHDPAILDHKPGTWGLKKRFPQK
tara:strand:+ start:1851 stop:2192 length:342 start_codon:yes stop_codon:yes gene_type:complete